MAEIAFRYRVTKYKQADLGTYIDAGNELAQKLRRDIPIAEVTFLDTVKSDQVLTARGADSVVNPTAANGTNYTWTRTGINGAAAGNHTVTGILTTDVLIAVVHVDDTTHASTDKTSEYTISAADTINNTSGTSSVGSHVVVVYYRPVTGTAPAAV